MAPIGIFRLISHNGGWYKSMLTIHTRDDLKLGHFKGMDFMGNRYYENDYYFFGRNRWVAFADRFGFDYDGSCVEARWFRWLHYVTDIPPNQEECQCLYDWMLPHTENLTGTEHEYVPYSTTPPKIIPWKPPKPPKPCLLKK